MIAFTAVLPDTSIVMAAEIAVTRPLALRFSKDHFIEWFEKNFHSRPLMQPFVASLVNLCRAQDGRIALASGYKKIVVI